MDATELQIRRSIAHHAPGWTRTARLLHWGMALAILIEVPVGFTMAWTYGAARKTGTTAAELHLRASQAHHTIGLLVLLAVVFRLWWRARHPAPTWAPTPAPGLERGVARGVQGLLYSLLLLVPLTGWAALSSLGAGAGYPAASLWFFGYDGFGRGGLIPHIVSPVAWNAPGVLRYGTFAKAHVWLLMTGGVVLTAHISAALFHHFVRHDQVLRRMVSGRAR